MMKTKIINIGTADTIEKQIDLLSQAAGKAIGIIAGPYPHGKKQSAAYVIMDLTQKIQNTFTRTVILSTLVNKMRNYSDSTLTRIVSWFDPETLQIILQADYTLELAKTMSVRDALFDRFLNILGDGKHDDLLNIIQLADPLNT